MQLKARDSLEAGRQRGWKDSSDIPRMAWTVSKGVAVGVGRGWGGSKDRRQEQIQTQTCRARRQVL